MNYVVGFLFNNQRTHVVLLRKNNPEWQKGLLNGVGGKVEVRESPHAAMNRESMEELKFTVPWDFFAHFMDCDTNLYLFRYTDTKSGEMHNIPSENDVGEQFAILAVNNLHNVINNCVYNLNYIIPMAMDNTIQFVTCSTKNLIGEEM